MEVTFGLAAGYGLVALLTALGVGAADGAVRRAAASWMSGPDDRTRSSAQPPWWTVLCVLPGLMFGGVLAVAYLLLSWFTGDGCLPLYGGPCPPKTLLPYRLFYVLSAGPLALAWMVALLVARSRRRGSRADRRRFMR